MNWKLHIILRRQSKRIYEKRKRSDLFRTCRSVRECNGQGEEKSYVRYRVDIWHNRSTSESALKVDKALAALGLVRTLCQDTPDPSGLKHKVMRYEAIIDMESEEVFWPN